MRAKHGMHSRLEDFQPGETGTYINDLFTTSNRNLVSAFICHIPESVAWTWLKDVVPDTQLGTGHTAKDHFAYPIRYGVDNAWLNKLWVCVGAEYDCAFVLYNHDGRIQLHEVRERRYE